MQNKQTIAHSIIKTLHQKGFQAVLAGGCVRDDLRGVAPKDFDIATSAKPDEIIALFEKTVEVGVHFGVVLVIQEGLPFEVATFRKDSKYIDGRHPESVSFSTLEEDAKRRDFTINGLYYDISTKKVLDFVEGEKDLKKKIIRTIGDPETRFLEDHLRMLRAIRFSVQLNFEIEKNTYAKIKEHAHLITNVSQERIRDEFSKMLTSGAPSKALKMLDEVGLLKLIIPEVEIMKGVEQPIEYHPEGDVFIHTMMLMDGLSHAPIELAMGCLLHDIAKPQTFERAPDRIRFHGHDTLGAKMAEVICRRMTFSSEQTQLISDLVLDHLRFKDAFQMRTSTLKRFLSIPRFDLHLELHRLDCMASHKHLDAYNFCKQKYEEFLKEPPPPLRLLKGEDLIAMGFKPSPLFSKIIREVEDGILEGTITTKESAIEFVKKKWPQDAKTE